MKRHIVCVLLCLLLCLGMAISVSAQEILVHDGAGLLTDWEKEELEQRLWEVSEASNAQIIVVTATSVPNDDVDAYIEDLYDSMGYGYGTTRSGVMLLVCMDLRQYRILSNGEAGDVIGDAQIASISDAVASNLTQGDYGAAFQAFANKCDGYLNGGLGGISVDVSNLPVDMEKTIMISLGIGLVVGIIVMVILKGQLKSVRPQHQADAYIISGSMRVTVARDLFLYRNVSKTRKQTNNSSGGGSRGGGSRHVGGGSF